MDIGLGLRPNFLFGAASWWHGLLFVPSGYSVPLRPLEKPSSGPKSFCRGVCVLMACPAPPPPSTPYMSTRNCLCETRRRGPSMAALSTPQRSETVPIAKDSPSAQHVTVLSGWPALMGSYTISRAKANSTSSNLLAPFTVDQCQTRPPANASVHYYWPWRASSRTARGIPVLLNMRYCAYVSKLTK